MKQLFFRYLKNTTTFTISLFMLLFAATKTNAQWIELGGLNNSPLTNGVRSIVTDKAGNIYTGGGFTDFGTGQDYVGKWNGTSWTTLGGTNGSFNNGGITCIAINKAGTIYAAGNFFDTSGNYYVAKWNGTAWVELAGTNGSPFPYGNQSNWIYTIAVDLSGNVYAGGGFTDSKGNYYVAKWNGTSWSELGGAAGGFNGRGDIGYIYSIATDTSGNVYAGGVFEDSTPAGPYHGGRYVAKWDGTAWSELGGTNKGFFAIINSVATDAGGNVYAAGSTTDSKGNHYVAKWDGTTWSQLGGANDSLVDYNGELERVTTDAAGNVYAVGEYLDSAGNRSGFVGKWNGTKWSTLAGGNNSPFNDYVDGVAADAHGNIYVGGNFLDSNNNYYIAEYAQNILPVAFVSFAAIKQDKNVVINWQTANEINTAYFSIQRSTDGRSFASIGKVAAKGSNKVNNDYAYVDDNLSQLNADRLYYRLQEVDNDGRFNYSGIKVMDVNKNSNLFTISPNPAKDFINISSSSNVANAQVSVTDMNGRTLYTAKQNFTANQQIKIPASQFAKQVLIVTINTGNGKQEFKVVKE